MSKRENGAKKENGSKKDHGKKKSKKNTSLRLDEKTLKQLKIRAIEEDTSVQALVERLITDYLEGKEGV